MENIGTMALEDGARVDFAALRAQRRARCLEAMERQGVDVLILGREANARYATGARRLWTAGTRPFGPGCVVVRETGDVHLLSTWDEGIPPEVARENLYGITWNPANFAAALGRVPGLPGARRIGVDGMSAVFASLLGAVAPDGELVDGDAVVREARRTKTAGELACIRTAVAVAESALSATAAALHPGMPERELAGTFLAAMAALGVTTPAMEGTFCVVPTEPAAGAGQPPVRLLATDRAVNAGDLVVLSGGVLYAGYEGSVARTWVCPGAPDAAVEPARPLLARWEALWARLAAAIGPGATGAELLSAYEASGEPLPPFPVAHGVGLGMEPPLIGPGGGDEVLEDGMVLAVQGYVWEEGVGGVLVRETVAVTPGGHEVLTRHAHGPLGV